MASPVQPSNREQIEQILQSYAFYRDGSFELREELLDAATYVEPTDGQELIEAGRPCSDVLLVGRGDVRVFIAGESGREVTLYHVRGGETCPVNLSAAMLGVSAFAHATALNDLRALVFTAAQFRNIGERHRALGDFLFAATVSRFGEVIALIREITTRRVDHRLADFLIRKFDQSDDSPPTIHETQQMIALELGTAREVVSRRLHELESVGAVQLGRGQIKLIDKSALFRISDAG